jgi:hypothetical protein
MQAKKIMKIFTERTSKNLIWIGVLLIIIGLISFKIGERIFDYNSEIKADKIGQLGDFFGGVIGSIWTLAGVILFYVALNKQVEALDDQKRSTIVAIDSLKVQSKELQLQRTELQETRKEFLMNRTTNVVYHQLERFEKSLKDLTIHSYGLEYKGSEAFTFLDENRNNVYREKSDTENEFKDKIKMSIITLLGDIYLPNKSNIESFAQNAYNSVEVLKRLIYKTKLDIEELNDIKKLFFVNIGFVNMGVIERISEVAVEELEYLETEDYTKYNLDPGKMMRSNIYLKSIKEFYQLHLTKDNYEEEKSKWEKNQGN